MIKRSEEGINERLRKYGFQTDRNRFKGLTTIVEVLDLSDLDLMTIRDLMIHSPDTADEYLAGMLGLMLAALGEGSLCLLLDRQHPDRTFSQAGQADGLQWVAEFVRKMDAGCYDGLIDRTGGSCFKPLVLDETTDRTRLYFQKFHYHEKRLKSSLKCFLTLPERRRLPAATIESVIDGLYRENSVIRSGAGRQPIARDPFQTAAIRTALTLPLSIVSGGPGTGKTSLLVNMLRALVQTGTDPSRILLAAPTGRAALRMSEALTANLATIANPDENDKRLAQLRGSTLHKMLVYNSRRDTFLYGRHRPLDADIIAVDEVSMVDVIMMDRLFQAIDPRRTRVILIGDKDQLPSVEAGSVLSDLSPAAGNPFSDNIVVLNNCYRSAGRLLDLAQTINAGQALEPEPVSFADALKMRVGQWAFVDTGSQDAIRSDLHRWVRHYYFDQRQGQPGSYVEMVVQLASAATGHNKTDEWRKQVKSVFSLAQCCRILSLLRKGPRGVKWLNNAIAAALQPLLDPGGRPGGPLFNGALIMITRNDYERGLFNGDQGVILLDSDGIYQACFERYEGLVMFPAVSLPDWDLAFAMTVHKSQGSEFQDTWLILPESPGHRLLTREIVYTAVTRASRRLILSGKAAVLQAALKKKILRQSGLMEG